MRALFLVLSMWVAAPVAAAATTAAAPAPAAATRVVVALTTGELKEVEGKLVKGLPNLRAHYAAQGRPLETVVVIYGEAYKFFLKSLDGTPWADDAALRARTAEVRDALAALARDHGVRFEICLSGMAKRNLKMENVHPFVHGTKNAFIALVDYQQAGYALLTFD